MPMDDSLSSKHHHYHDLKFAIVISLEELLHARQRHCVLVMNHSIAVLAALPVIPLMSP